MDCLSGAVIEMAIKTIAVLIDAAPNQEARIAYAVNLSVRHEAYLIGVFQTPSTFPSDAASSFARGHRAIAEALQYREAQQNALIDQARKNFSNLAFPAGIRCEFRIHNSRTNDERRLSLLHADLVIAGTPKGWAVEDRPASDVLQLATGVPFLLLPDSWQNTNPAQHVLIGWNATRESRRAIGDALPLLAAATSVTVLIVEPDANISEGKDPGFDVGRFLLRHGVRVTVDPVKSNGRATADVIIDYAVSNRHDLIVLGAYSHSRSRELVLGGVTRYLLAQSPVPLLISH